MSTKYFFPACALSSHSLHIFSLRAEAFKAFKNGYESLDLPEETLDSIIEDYTGVVDYQTLKNVTEKISEIRKRSFRYNSS